ncbi:serine hydrolase domain-containing protein [Methylococcus mesophilus]|uniref:serine hydrolase domain-containing protein n=1 Tax=Methylococcus mesophilus TaxID=2993564 RepID=UPI00224B9982|nr:serine hydrolase domain-containing protein [Methylococcus mesophilus]UZR29802.1 serine hydrolase [Methylococcus mesophilus]
MPCDRSLPPTAILTYLNQLVHPLIDKGEVYGMAVGMLTPDGKTQVFGFGRTGTGNGRQVLNGNTIFQIGSLSKLFISSLLVMLVADGTLHYEDTLRSILPSEVELSPEAGRITLLELATHTSGLPREPHSLTQLGYLIRYGFTGENLYEYLDRNTAYEYLRTWRPSAGTERRYRYSNLGAGLLGHLIEVKTGKALPELMATRISRPLGLRDTVFELNPEQRTRLATGHAGEEPFFMLRNSDVPAWDLGEFMRAAGGIYSTANDMLIFTKASLKLLGSSLDEVLASAHRIGFDGDDGYLAEGWLIDYRKSYIGTVVYKHGLIAGYTSYVGMQPVHKVAVVALQNSFNWKDRVGHNLLLCLASRYAAAGSE